MFSALYTVTPPTAEPVSAATVKQHTRIDTDADDALIAAYITAARQWIEKTQGRCYAQQQLQWVIAREQSHNGYPYLSMPLSLLVLPQWLSYPFWMQRGGIKLPRQPVVSVDAVAYGQWGKSDTTLTAGTDYFVDTASARLQIQPGSEVLPNDHLAITFTAGYGSYQGPTVNGQAPPAVSLVPQNVLQAIMMLTAFLYENRGDVGAEPPAAVDMLLAPDRLISFG